MGQVKCTSGITNFLILVPLFALISDVNAIDMITTAVGDFESFRWFIVAGFFAYFGFSLWYKGNAMCGTALGMSCNGAFSFWGPFFCWLVLGLWFGIDGYPCGLAGYCATASCTRSTRQVDIATG